MLQSVIFQRALITALLTSLAVGIIGTYVVVKRMSLISGSIAHTAFGGLGISYYLQTNPLIGAIIFSLGAAGLITIIRNKAKGRMDTLLSAIWAIGMAIGLVFIFLSTGYASDLFSYLFGNILLVKSSDLLLILVLDVIILSVAVFFHRSILSVIFDEENALVRNMPVNAVYFLLFAMIALTVVMLLRVVGIILMIALISMPAATAQLYCRTLKRIMVWTGIISLFSIVSGLVISYAIDFQTGPIIIIIVSLIYLLGLLFQSSKSNNKNRRSSLFPR